MSQSTPSHTLSFLPGTRLCSVDDLPEGKLREFRSGVGDNAFGVILYRQGDSVRGYVNMCPHLALPLNALPDDFILTRSAQVLCAWHNAVFRLEDGYCIDGPSEGAHLQSVPIVVRDRDVLIGEPAGAAPELSA